MSRCISSSSSVLLLSLWKSSLSCSCSLSSQSARLAEAAAWRRRARRRQTGGSGGAAGGCGRQPAPAAVKTTVLCFPQTLSAPLRSASLFCCNSPQLWLYWAGRQCRCDPPEICLEPRPQDGWRCSLLPPSAGPAALLSRCPLPVSASRDQPQLQHSVTFC